MAYVYDSAGVTNGIGRLASVSNGFVTTGYNAYDAMGRQLSVSREIGGAPQIYTTTYSYDAAGRQKGINISGLSLTNSYYPHSMLLKSVQRGTGVEYGRFTNYEPNAKIGSVFHGNGTVCTEIVFT